MISRMDQPLVLGIIDWSYMYRGRWGRRRRRRRRIEDSNSKNPLIIITWNSSSFITNNDFTFMKLTILIVCQDMKQTNN